MEKIKRFLAWLYRGIAEGGYYKITLRDNFPDYRRELDALKKETARGNGHF